MTRKVEGLSLLDTANSSNLFEVVVALLIGGYREQSVVAATILISIRGRSDGETNHQRTNGVWVMTKYDIKYSNLLQAVRTAFETSYGAQTPVDDVERLERNTGETVYFIEATIVVNGYLADIYLDYAPDGTLLRTAVDVEDYDNIYYYLP